MAAPGIDTYTTRRSRSLLGSSIRIATMDGFDHILNWKFRHGSHRFPGRDGGTCINEAALVAAGFWYRPIRRAENMPECFSRPICRLAMQLNDSAREAERQRLLPFCGAARLRRHTRDREREGELYRGADANVFLLRRRSSSLGRSACHRPAG